MNIPSSGLPIAYLELLAAMVAIVCFSPLCPQRLVKLNCDNTGAVAWLKKSRCPAGIGFRILAVAELYKHKYCLKVSTTHIMGVGNSSADSLSRGIIPKWLQEFGHRREVNLTNLVNLMYNPLNAWKEIM